MTVENATTVSGCGVWCNTWLQAPRGQSREYFTVTALARVPTARRVTPSLLCRKEVNMAGPLSMIQRTMSDQTRAQLQSWVRHPTRPWNLVRRARALLLEQGGRIAPTARRVGLTERNLRKWARRFCELGLRGLREQPRAGRPPVFGPRVALYVVKLACEWPDQFGRSLSQWNCSDLACQLRADGMTPSISAETVR